MKRGEGKVGGNISGYPQNSGVFDKGRLIWVRSLIVFPKNRVKIKAGAKVGRKNSFLNFRIKKASSPINIGKRNGELRMAAIIKQLHLRGGFLFTPLVKINTPKLNVLFLQALFDILPGLKQNSDILAWRRIG